MDGSGKVIECILERLLAGADQKTGERKTYAYAHVCDANHAHTCSKSRI